MAAKGAGIAMKARAAASRPTAREPLIVAAAFLNGMVTVSSVPMISAQAAYVSFPSGAHLAAYQLCFLVPQLLTTLVAEELTLHVSACALLLATLLCSTGSTAIVALSLSRRALPLFFASCFLNGLFRHDKTLFAVTANALHMPNTGVSAASQYGMMAGMLFSGIAGDLVSNAVHHMCLFVGLEAAAVALVLARFLLGSRTVVVTARVSQEYARWLPTLARAPAVVYRALALLIAVLLAASVNQVMYPIVGPTYGLSYSFIGAHLCFNLVLQMILVPRVVEVAKGMARSWRPNTLLVGNAEEKLMIATGTLLLAGCSGVPYAADHGPIVFYLSSLLLVDLPAGVLTALAASVVQDAFGKASGDAPKVTRLVRHITQVVKMFAAPLLICTSERLTGCEHPVRCISVPLMTYALVYTRTRSVASAAAGLVATLLLLTSHISSFEGEL
ncbi:hypothetical protein GH5_06691 [Leishmania sp. Ghana 2012 LV757]|uniref:hypothetical protein n=1 Tax=Leishmania sp. Ghana 2012 LV757 TaxID=2803181 RepID=UPI001B45B5A9|nr:hypothetical protein GH5_06691 [Leishmania sp. Ghana 2012 LV757]